MKNILSNDPRDVIRRQIKIALKERGGGTASIVTDATSMRPKHSTDVVKDHISLEDVPSEATNPVGRQGSFLVSILGAIFAFWSFVVGRFWYMIPMMAVALYLMVTPEDMAKLVEQGMSVGTIAKGALNYFIWGSIASLIPPMVIGNVLRAGRTIQKRTVVLLQLPAFFLAFLTFWSLASLAFFFFMG